MNLIIRLILTAIAAYFAAKLVPGVEITGAKGAIIFAIVLGILNAILKPILVILTIPITIITLGLFLLVINIIIIFVADALVSGFSVEGWLAALIFSLVMAVIGYILGALFD